MLKNRNAPQLRLMKNVIEDLPPSIAFRLRGAKSNRDAIGAAVTVESDSGRQTKSLQAGSGFLSQHTKELIFGLGRAKGPVSVSIAWPSGSVQRIQGLPVNHRIWIEEGAEPTRREPFTKSAQPSIANPGPARFFRRQWKRGCSCQYPRRISQPYSHCAGRPCSSVSKRRHRQRSPCCAAWAHS